MKLRRYAALLLCAALTRPAVCGLAALLNVRAEEAETGTEAPGENPAQAETSVEEGTETEIPMTERPEAETPPGEEPETGTLQEETEPGGEKNTEDAAEAGTEADGTGEETEDAPETESRTAETETETGSRTAGETGTEKPTEILSAAGDSADSRHSPSGAFLWDASWFLAEDFRFTQVDKRYAVIENGGAPATVLQEPWEGSAVAGTLPYFSICYVLEETADSTGQTWYYIESGGVRGFIKPDILMDASCAQKVVEAVGGGAFATGAMAVEKADNEAFTYTHTTVYEVLAGKEYAVALCGSGIYEYRDTSSRMAGSVFSGTLVYVLEDAGDGWLYVESGDVRGFLEKDVILSGEAAEGIIGEVGEEEAQLAKQYLEPEENRSVYFTFRSTKSAVTTENVGAQVAAFALSFVGKLPYVWGGTSLTEGADCSGFTQSVFAAFGISIPRLAQEQGAYGREVDSLSDAQPGDIVYYASGPHVGIYIGNGFVVQCSGAASDTADSPGRGPTVSPAPYRPVTSIRRYILSADSGGSSGTDAAGYTQEQLELIWAIVAQEDNGSYEGALAVISSAMNRTESARWGYLGSTALEQLTASGQYCYSLDSYWQARLNGNVPDYVKQAVYDCLEKGIRNHSYTSFRSTKGKVTGADAVQIGGNWYFGT